MTSIAELEKAKREAREKPNTLNLEPNITRQLRVLTDPLVDEFLIKFDGQFEGKIKQEIIDETNRIRRRVFEVLELKCTAIMNQFNDQYDEFIKLQGWYTHKSAGIRHQITRDELAYELCECIRKVYYTYMEDRLPEKYRLEVLETYLLQDKDAAKD